ncbi:casein kinase II, regulatory subunit, partial [Catenaria anguillulae PL171]
MQTISIRPESHAYPLHQPPAHSSGHSRPQESLSASPSPSASPSTPYEFQLTGLAAMVPFFHESLDLILDRDAGSSSQLLYTLIHARWIITKAGLQAMLEKIENASLAFVPVCYALGIRSPCRPFDLPGMGPSSCTVSCQDTYHPQSNRFARLDGASIGSTFPTSCFCRSLTSRHILELTRDPASPGKDSVFY